MSKEKLPQKFEDSSSFTIPCTICDLFVSRVLTNLGASINLFPYNVFKMFDLREPKLTRMSIQLADRTINYPRGIIEDVLL